MGVRTHSMTSLLTTRRVSMKVAEVYLATDDENEEPQAEISLARPYQPTLLSPSDLRELAALSLEMAALLEERYSVRIEQGGK